MKGRVTANKTAFRQQAYPNSTEGTGSTQQQAMVYPVVKVYMSFCRQKKGE